MHKKNLALALAVTLAVVVTGCTKQEPIKSPFSDSYDRPELGGNYHNTGGPYSILEGKLKIKGAYNHPLWLKKMLPRDAEIAFDVTSNSPDGDIKVEAWGDGRSYATTKGAYLATSYVFIFGAWDNTKSIIARMDEHAPELPMRMEPKVVTGKTYHWKIRRKGKKVEWFIDGKPFLEYVDEQPLEGAKHAYFGFNNWQSDLQFDNLSIKPL
jgi:Farnesoic acid 0-methyl transferase